MHVKPPQKPTKSTLPVSKKSTLVLFNSPKISNPSMHKSPPWKVNVEPTRPPLPKETVTTKTLLALLT